MERYLDLPVLKRGEELPNLLGVVFQVAGVLQGAFLRPLQKGLGLVALAEQAVGVGAGYLIDVEGRVYGAGDAFGGHESFGEQREDRRHREPVASRQRDQLRERLSERHLPYREP